MLKRILLLMILVVVVLAVVAVYLINETRQLDGVVRDAETGGVIQGAQINAAGFSSVTDAQGKYEISIPRGEYTLTAQADGYVSTETPLNGDDLFSRSFAIDFVLPQNLVSIVITDTETSQPLSNATIKVGDASFTTNAQGLAQARALKNGTVITIQAPGYDPLSVIYDGQGDFELGLTPNQVNVVVTNQYSKQPVVGAQLLVDNQTFATDAEGHALLRRIKPGTQIRTSLNGFDPATGSFSDGDVQLSMRPNTLDGVVTDSATGRPISGTLVYLGSTIVTTNAKGEYHLANVPAKAVLMLKAPAYRKITVDASGVSQRDVKLTPFLVKGIHIPFGMQPDEVRQLIDMVGKTELNSIVIDVKAEKGKIGWDSQVPLAKEIGAATNHGIDLTEVISRCKTQNIYCIARLPVFQDNLLASSRPAQAIRYTTGTVFTETAGQQWLNPYLTENWDYAIALAKEITAMGFDEIQFDYVRFPGRVGNLDYGTENTQETRIAAIAGFLARAQKELRPTGVFVSADVFGLTTATDDDQSTGQRLRDLSPYLDYVSPMVYPDTWVDAADLLTKGLQIPNCTEAIRCPYDVIFNSYKRASEKTSTKVRLWLQAYAGRGDFGIAQYRTQKKAATDAGSYGWMFWNGQGIYDPKMFDVKQ